MASSAQNVAQPLAAAEGVQLVPGGSPHPITLNNDAATITAWVNDPERVESVRQAAKVLAKGRMHPCDEPHKKKEDAHAGEMKARRQKKGTRSMFRGPQIWLCFGVPEKGKTGAEEEASKEPLLIPWPSLSDAPMGTPDPLFVPTRSPREWCVFSSSGLVHTVTIPALAADQDDEEAAGNTSKAGLWSIKRQTSRGGRQAKAKIPSFVKSVRSLYGKKVASVRKFFSGKKTPHSESTRNLIEHDNKEIGGKVDRAIVPDIVVMGDQSAGCGIKDHVALDDIPTTKPLPRIIITPNSRSDSPVRVFPPFSLSSWSWPSSWPLSWSSSDLDGWSVDPVAQASQETMV